MFLIRLLKKLVNKIKYSLTRRKFKEVTETQFGRQYLAELAGLLEPSLFQDLTISDARLTQTLGAGSLVELTDVLAKINVALRTQQVIPNDCFTSITHVRRFDEFVGRDSGNYYVELAPSVARYRKVVIDFCALMEPSDTAEVGLMEHNRRILTRPACIVRQITIRLLENVHLNLR